MRIFACHKAVFTHQDPGFLVEGAIQVQNIYHGQFVPQSYFIVIGIVCRGDLEAPCSKIHGNVVIGNNWDFLVYQGY